MKIVVIGGTGLIGSNVVARLTDEGHEAVAAAPESGVNTYTGEGLADALVGADVVIDVANSPSFEDAAVLDFFTTTSTNVITAERAAGVRHHVALSVVGTGTAERFEESGYMRAKAAQERLIKDSGVPYTIVHATQFFEFVRSIANEATVGDTVHLSSALIQPIAAAEVSAAVARAAVGAPLNGTVEVAGPERFTMHEFVRTGLAAKGDPRTVVVDSQARYFGARLDEDTLLPGKDATLSEQTFADWLAVPANVAH